MDPYPLKSKTGPVSLQDTAKKLISGEDPHPVEFDNFWPAGSVTFFYLIRILPVTTDI